MSDINELIVRVDGYWLIAVFTIVVGSAAVAKWYALSAADTIKVEGYLLKRMPLAAADFSRIRQVKLDRFTIDRLMAILSKLDRRVDVSVETKPRPKRSDLAHHASR